MDVALTPYLMFDGTCREAMEFYRRALGGDLQVMTYGETGPDAPDAMKDRVMHAHLTGGAADLMAGDVPPGGSLGTGKIRLALGGTDEGALRAIFDALAEGGTVHDPIERQAWGDLYGAAEDRYGIDWMVNIRAA